MYLLKQYICTILYKVIQSHKIRENGLFQHTLNNISIVWIIENIVWVLYCTLDVLSDYNLH